VRQMRPIARLPDTDKPILVEKIVRVMITEQFDLRGMEPKQDVMIRTPLCSGWMVFLNKACTLAHIMHQLDASEGTYIRMKVPHRLRNMHVDYIRRYFFYRMKGRFVI
jgi:hypothetical protein